MTAPRKKASSALAGMLRPGMITAQWGDGPLLQFERLPPPFTDQTFWEACNSYFPPELLSTAAAYLLEKDRRAQQAGAKKAGKGRPPRGIGQQVQDLMTGPLEMKQDRARRLIAVRLCKCRYQDGFRVEPCVCDAYARVVRLHKQWRSDRRKGKSRG